MLVVINYHPSIYVRSHQQHVKLFAAIQNYFFFIVFFHARFHENVIFWFSRGFFTCSFKILFATAEFQSSHKFSTINLFFFRNTVSRFTNFSTNSLDSKKLFCQLHTTNSKHKLKNKIFPREKLKKLLRLQRRRETKKKKQNSLKRGPRQHRWFIQHILPTTLPCHSRGSLRTPVYYEKSIIHRQH